MEGLSAVPHKNKSKKLKSGTEHQNMKISKYENGNMKTKNMKIEMCEYDIRVMNHHNPQQRYEIEVIRKKVRKEDSFLV